MNSPERSSEHHEQQPQFNFAQWSAGQLYPAITAVKDADYSNFSALNKIGNSLPDALQQHWQEAVARAEHNVHEYDTEVNSQNVPDELGIARETIQRISIPVDHNRRTSSTQKEDLVLETLNKEVFRSSGLLLGNLNNQIFSARIAIQNNCPLQTGTTCLTYFTGANPIVSDAEGYQNDCTGNVYMNCDRLQSHIQDTWMGDQGSNNIAQLCARNNRSTHYVETHIDRARRIKSQYEDLETLAMDRYWIVAMEEICHNRDSSIVRNHLSKRYLNTNEMGILFPSIVLNDSSHMKVMWDATLQEAIDGNISWQDVLMFSKSIGEYSGQLQAAALATNPFLMAEEWRRTLDYRHRIEGGDQEYELGKEYLQSTFSSVRLVGNLAGVVDRRDLAQDRSPGNAKQIADGLTELEEDALRGSLWSAIKHELRYPPKDPVLPTVAKDKLVVPDAMKDWYTLSVNGKTYWNR